MTDMELAEEIERRRGGTDMLNSVLMPHQWEQIIAALRRPHVGVHDVAEFYKDEPASPDGETMTSRPAVPESLVEQLREAEESCNANQNQHRWGRLFSEAATALSLAQTEIKGHMRNESDLLNELALARADWACAQARIAELEKERDQQERFKWEANKRADKFKETLEKIEAEAYAHHELAGDIARSALRVKSRA